jgi:serine/threonine protein kinase
MLEEEGQIDSARRNLQKCLREFRESLAQISRLSVSLFPELPLCMNPGHLSGKSEKGSLALELFIQEPEVAALFDGDRGLSHYTNITYLSRTPQSRHDVDRASFDGQHVALKKYNLQSEASIKTLRQELAVLARLKHPNIISVRLFFEEKGAAYVEFPMYDCDMEAWLNGGSPPHTPTCTLLRMISCAPLSTCTAPE